MNLSIITLNHEANYSGLVRAIGDNFPFGNIKVFSRKYNDWFGNKNEFEVSSMCEKFHRLDDYVLAICHEKVWEDQTMTGLYFEKTGPIGKPKDSFAVVPLYSYYARRFVPISLHELGHLFGLKTHRKRKNTPNCPMTEERNKTLKEYISSLGYSFCDQCKKQIKSKLNS